MITDEREVIIMTRVREFFDDVVTNVAFAFAMARDVKRALKEERENEKLCLYIN